MTARNRHRVVTVPRGTTEDGRPGFAARCEDCDAITFGGNSSRSAARAQLAGHEDAPSAAGTAAEGDDQKTELHQGEPVMTIIPDGPEVREAISSATEAYAAKLHTAATAVLDDPGFLAWLRPEWIAAGSTQRMAYDWAERHGSISFDWPDEATPSWAHEVEDGMPSGNELSFNFVRRCEDGEVTAEIRANVTVVVFDDVDDGTKAGDYIPETQLSLSINGFQDGEHTDARRAHDLARALDRAAADMEAITSGQGAFA